ncbi:MAG: DUF1559 domain-containing protein [Fuerstiella sp.]
MRPSWADGFRLTENSFLCRQQPPPTRATHSAATQVGVARVNWVVTCLSELDRQDIFDRFDQTVGISSTVNLALAQLHLAVLTCPDDDSAFAQPGGLSYVINAGYADMKVLNAYDAAILAGNLPVQTQVHAHDINQFDWDGDGNVPGVPDPAYFDSDDAVITRDTGMSWLQIRSRNFSQTMNTVYDGFENTLFFTENINAGWTGTWSNPTVSNCGFVYPVESTTASGATFPNPPIPRGVDGLPNAMRHNGEGTPFPSSNHPGIINIVLVSGSARTLSEQIDRSVYVRLATPNGSKLRSMAGFLPQDPIGDAF